MSSARELPEDLPQKIHIDNLFRLAVSLISLTIAIFLWMFRVVPELRPLLVLWGVYTLPYLTVWGIAQRTQNLRALDYLLNTLDIVCITWAIHLTGGLQSPFFYLYGVPFLVQAFHFDMGTV